MESIGIIGSGQMGGGIAQVSAAGGYRVLLADLDLATAEKGKAKIASTLEGLVRKEKLTADDRERILDLIQPVPDLTAMADAGLVIEAATEREPVKRTIFENLRPVLGQDAILATNTSSISITRLAQAAPDPDRFVGVHFFNPVPLMALVEIISGLATAQSTLDRVEAYATKIGKSVVHARDSHGFIVNRVLIPLLNEAVFLLSEGVASVPDIDNAVKLGLNHPMGPLTLSDMVGLDTLLDICRVFYETTGDPKYRPAPLLVQYVDAGWLGRKTGRGFYDYSGPEPVPTRLPRSAVYVTM